MEAKDNSEEPENQKIAEEDEAVLRRYFKGTCDLDNIYQHFHKSDIEHMDKQDIETLMFRALCIFCHERDSSNPKMKQNVSKPFVQNLVVTLKPEIYEKEDVVIKRDEFGPIGEYLQTEWKKLQKEIEPLVPKQEKTAGCKCIVM